jgi:VanZ family protein
VNDGSTDAPPTVVPHRTRLPHALALLYGLAIIYASLQPFGDWVEPAPGTPFFLFATWPSRWLRYDFLLNIIAYAPFGLFVGWLPARASPLARVALGALAGAALSFAMETLQMYLPQRVASTADLVSNTLGALVGAGFAAAFARSERFRGAIRRKRAQLFLDGHLGDFGIALLLLWTIAQINPGIPLFAVTFDPDPTRGLAVPAAPVESAALLIEAAESAFQMLGVGLFIALLLRERRFIGGAILVLIGVALMLKGVAAALVIRPAAWETWQRPGVTIGIAAGALLILTAVNLARPAMVAVCGIALLSSVGVPILAPDLLFARAPLTLFNWRYGQLLNYNGLTRTILLVWPLLAAIWLFALAGRPAWGHPDTLVNSRRPPRSNRS